MNPDYTGQLERLITILSQKDPLPTWVISIISVVIGAFATLFLGLLKEKHEAKRRKKRVERAICGELLLNYASLFGMLTPDFDFHRVAANQKAFDGIFTFDALETARGQVEVLYDIPHFAVVRTLYKMYEMMSNVQGGGPNTEGLAQDRVRNFESFFVSSQLNQQLLIELSETCAPNMKARLLALSVGSIKPGEKLKG
jgi:hypothetical protein